MARKVLKEKQTKGVPVEVSSKKNIGLKYYCPQQIREMRLHSSQSTVALLIASVSFWLQSVED